MSGKILIGYASKYGSTAEIAGRIGATLTAAGLDVEVAPAERAGEVSSYTAVVLGSAVYAGNWRPEIVKLLESAEAALAGRPVWLFSSGPTGDGDPVEMMKGWRFPPALEGLLERIGPRDVAFFHGVIDPKKMNLPERLIIKALKAPAGDYRDWEAIESWAQGIAAALKG